MVLMRAMHLQLTQEKPAADEEGVPGLALELVLPGVTVPWAHALYLWIATAVSLGVHEVCCLFQSSSLPADVCAESPLCQNLEIAQTT